MYFVPCDFILKYVWLWSHYQLYSKRWFKHSLAYVWNLCSILNTCLIFLINKFKFHLMDTFEVHMLINFIYYKIQIYKCEFIKLKVVCIVFKSNICLIKVATFWKSYEYIFPWFFIFISTISLYKILIICLNVEFTWKNLWENSWSP